MSRMSYPAESAPYPWGGIDLKAHRYRPGMRVVIVNHILAGLTGTVVSTDQHGQINLRIDEVDTSPVTVREQHLEMLD